MDYQLLQFFSKQVQELVKFRVNLKKNQRFSYLDQVSSSYSKLYSKLYLNSQTTLTVEEIV